MTALCRDWRYCAWSIRRRSGQAALHRAHAPTLYSLESAHHPNDAPIETVVIGGLENVEACIGNRIQMPGGPVEAVSPGIRTGRERGVYRKLQIADGEIEASKVGRNAGVGLVKVVLRLLLVLHEIAHESEPDGSSVRVDSGKISGRGGARNRFRPDNRGPCPLSAPAGGGGECDRQCEQARWRGRVPMVCARARMTHGAPNFLCPQQPAQAGRSAGTHHDCVVNARSLWRLAPEKRLRSLRASPGGPASEASAHPDRSGAGDRRTGPSAPRRQRVPAPAA